MWRNLWWLRPPLRNFNFSRYLLIHESQSRNERGLAKRWHLLSATTVLLSSEIEAERASSKWGERRHAEAGKQLDFMEVVLQYIEDNIDKHLTINGVARQMSISRAAFTRHFREHTGQSFHQYYTQLRMQRATEQLVKTDLPVAIICRQVGLKYGQLRALFQKSHGCAPGEFREEKQKHASGTPS